MCPTESRSSSAMAPPFFPPLLLLLLPLLPVTSLPVSAADSETCYFRQHQKVNINLHLASHASSVAAVARAVRSEQACVRACCSEEVKPGQSVAVMGPGHP